MTTTAPSASMTGLERSATTVGSTTRCRSRPPPPAQSRRRAQPARGRARPASPTRTTCVLTLERKAGSNGRCRGRYWRLAPPPHLVQVALHQVPGDEVEKRDHSQDEGQDRAEVVRAQHLVLSRLDPLARAPEADEGRDDHDRANGDRQDRDDRVVTELRDPFRASEIGHL